MPRTVIRVLSSNPDFKNEKKMIKNPILTKLHQEKRLAWTRAKLSFGKN